MSSMTSWIDFRCLTVDSTCIRMAEVQDAQPAHVDVPQSGSSSSSVPPEGYDKKCIFCRIVNNEMGTELLHNVSILEEININALLASVRHFGCQHLPLETVKSLQLVLKNI